MPLLPGFLLMLFGVVLLTVHLELERGPSHPLWDLLLWVCVMLFLLALVAFLVNVVQ